MSVALQLAPDNRHVLRSASRLFLHQGNPEKAHDLLVNSPATRGDPWLLAGEIALSELANRSPRFLKLGVRLLDDAGMPPRQITELAGAIGTTELLDGSRKKSRRLFTLSMKDPTGSALAQCEWATPALGSEIVPVGRLTSVHEAFEALAFHLYRVNRFGEVPQACEGWAEADPYSVRPCEFASNVAALNDDYVTAEKFARRGLRLRPDGPLLLNGLAFALASMDRLDEANAALRRLPRLDQRDELAYVAQANKGLIAFRAGRVEDAKHLYLEAVEGFRRLGKPPLAAMARVYLAREALRAGQPGAAALFNEAETAVATLKHSDAAMVLDRMKAVAGLEAPAQVPPLSLQQAPARPQVTWSTPGLPTSLKRLP
jgi:tetratricopeptide (TPR) repeat protein